jgi:hypothetical protein
MSPEKARSDCCKDELQRSCCNMLHLVRAVAPAVTANALPTRRIVGHPDKPQLTGSMKKNQSFICSLEPIPAAFNQNCAAQLCTGVVAMLLVHFTQEPRSVRQVVFDFVVSCRPRSLQVCTTSLSHCSRDALVCCASSAPLPKARRSVRPPRLRHKVKYFGTTDS